MREGCLDRTDGLAPLTGDQRRDLLEVVARGRRALAARSPADSDGERCGSGDRGQRQAWRVGR
jgi:hypothetical protein